MASIFDNTAYADMFGAANSPQQSGLVDQSRKLFSTSADLARNAVSPESRDRAAARLRAATDSQRLSNEAEIGGQMARRGVNNSGIADARQGMNRAASQQAFAQGLGTLEDNWARQDLEAAGVIGQQAQGLGSLGVNQVQTNIQGQQAATDAAKVKADTKLQTLLTYLTNGNSLQNPQGLAPILTDLGVDPTGLSFFSPGNAPANGSSTTTTLPGPGGSSVSTTNGGSNFGGNVFNGGGSTGGSGGQTVVTTPPVAGTPGGQIAQKINSDSRLRSSGVQASQTTSGQPLVSVSASQFNTLNSSIRNAIYSVTGFLDAPRSVREIYDGARNGIQRVQRVAAAAGDSQSKADAQKAIAVFNNIIKGLRPYL